MKSMWCNISIVRRWFFKRNLLWKL